MEARDERGIPWEVLERDYLLSWLLAGFDQVPLLRDSIAFKGGTALKKCYFGDYRFSEDLDFSRLKGYPFGAAMETSMSEVCKAAEKMLNEVAPVEIACGRYLEKEPHPTGQEAFTIRARFPWQRQLQTRLRIEITIDEKILRPLERRSILHGYGEPFEAEIKVYSLEEILAEKLRAILQHVTKLEQRGWSRSRARDYYDIWRMLDTFRDQMDLTDFSSFLRNKCAIRCVDFTGPDDFFQGPVLAYVEKTWEQWLGPLVQGLPAFSTVMGELRPRVEDLLAAGAS